MPVVPSPATPATTARSWLLRIALLLCLAVGCVFAGLALCGSNLPADRKEWLFRGVTALAFAALAINLARRLPAQNVLLACVIFLGGGVALCGLKLALGVLLDPRAERDAALEKRLWSVLPIWWGTALLVAREVSRVICRKRVPGGSGSFGLWVLGTAGLLFILLEITSQPILTGVLSLNPNAYAAPGAGVQWMVVLTRTAFAVLVLAVVTPALINKSPVKPSIDYFPLGVWLLLKVLLGTVVGYKQQWPMLAVLLAEFVMVACLLTIPNSRANPGLISPSSQARGT